MGVQCNTIVRSLVGKCIKCRLLRGKLGEQKMADLLSDRRIEELPYTNCGVDMFGPFIIKEGREELIRNGVIFTCFSSRTVHIERTCDLGTDSFIQALRRFVARRGKMVLILWNYRKNWKKHTVKWIIRRFNSSFRTLV